MKKLITLLTITSIAFLICCSCTKLDQPENTDVAVTCVTNDIVVSPSAVNLDAAGTPVVVKVSGAVGNMGCTLSNAVGKWISVDVKKDSLKGEFTLTIAATANTGASARSLKFSITDGKSLVWVPVSQSANN